MDSASSEDSTDSEDSVVDSTVDSTVLSTEDSEAPDSPLVPPPHAVMANAIAVAITAVTILFFIIMSLLFVNLCLTAVICMSCRSHLQ